MRLSPTPTNKGRSDSIAYLVYLYGLLAFLVFSPCLLFGRAYFDNDLLAQFGPWRAFLRDQLAQGHFPLWNPYLLGGQPFFADLQNMMLYPVNFLTLPFSVPYGLSVFFFIHMFLAALGMHLWLRSLGLSENACRVGALLFALSNFFWLEIIHPPVLAAFAWLPWLFYRLEQLARNPKPLNAFLAGFCFAMLFLCGSFQVILGALYGGAVYFLFRLFQRGQSLSLSTFRKFSPLALVFLWGALPLLGQFIPTLEFVHLSDRNTTDAQSEKLNSQLSLNPATLGQFLFPRITLPPDQDMAVALQSDKDATNFPMAANWGYLGIWLPFLLWGSWKRKERLLPFLFGLLGFLSLFYSFGRFTPFHSLLSAFLPGLSLIRVPYRFLYLWVFCISTLAALGWDALFPEGANKPAYTWKSPLVFALVLYFAALWRPIQNWREILGISLGFVGLELFAHFKYKLVGKVLFLSAIAFPLLLNGWSDFEIGPSSNFDYAEKSQAIMAAANSVKPHRLIFMSEEMYYPIEVGGKKYLVNYPQNAACALGIKNFGGYNPLTLHRKYLDSLPLIAIVYLGDVGGILTQTNHGTISGFKLESFPPYLLYRPLYPPGLDLKEKLEKEETDYQAFSDVEMHEDNEPVFHETMYPGWKAWVDGQPVYLSTYEPFLRTLNVPKGRHEVEFRFEPWWWTPIRISLALWLVITLGALLGILRKNFFAILQKIYYSIGGHGLGRIKVLRWAYDFFFRVLKPQSVMVQGHRMWLDDRDTLELATHPVYEPMETKLLEKELKEGQTFVDIGANIGYYTLLAARRVGSKGRVVAFEPDPSNFELLKKNVQENGYTNVTLVNKAVSNRARSLRLFLNEANRGDHRVYDSKDGRGSIAIQAVTLDGFFKELDKKVHFIKMDIQGSEAAALEGMKGLIRVNRSLKLVTEFSPASLKLCGSDPAKYLKTLQKLGFKLLEISEKNRSVKPVKPALLLKRPWGGSEDYTNLYCVKK